ncbi:MAG: Nif3-like dinuclear metal center hexameric protein [Bacteroidaceae bacterium]|nr:Nif3-like dinuclear metal center hexameric protein [Bacteroidaceae bacterium]
MKIKDIVCALGQFAPLPLQDSYDNAGLQVGLTDAEVTGALLCLDVTEAVVDEAIALGYNLIISHHPLIFRGFKSLTGVNYIERCIIKAIKHDIVVYAAHTNLDNALNGVSFKMAEKIGITNIAFLEPKTDCEPLQAGAGVIGTLPVPSVDVDFLHRIKEIFQVGCVRHTILKNRMIKKVALCGGAGAFLMEEAIKAGADVFITGEIKYHDFFGHDDEILLAEIGHYESEQYTKEIFKQIISEKFPEVPLKMTKVNTNPIYYL